MFFVYVLRSRHTGRLYIGYTSDLSQRLGQHNSGITKSTRNRGPWVLVHQERYATRAEAVRREKSLNWNLSHCCRTEDAFGAVEQAVLARLPEGSLEANPTLTTDNGTQLTSSRFLETIGGLGITHRRTAYHHPEGNSYIERFHRSLKEEEVWTAEYRSLEKAPSNIARWIEEYNHDRPHRGVENRTPHEALLAFTGVLNSKALTA